MLLPLNTIVLSASYITNASMASFSTGTSITTSLGLGPALHIRQTATNAIEAMNEPISMSTFNTGAGPLYTNISSTVMATSGPLYTNSSTYNSSGTFFSSSTSASSSSQLSVPPATTIVTVTVTPTPSSMVTITVVPVLPTTTTTSHTGLCWHTSLSGGPPGGMCLCTDSLLWAISPVMVTHTINGQAVLSVDACPFTKIPSAFTSTAWPSYVSPTTTTTQAPASTTAPARNARECVASGNGMCWVNGKCLPKCNDGVPGTAAQPHCYEWDVEGCPPQISIGIF